MNLDALGEEEVIFPQGKVMTLHQTLDTGFEYEVGVQLSVPDKKTFLPDNYFQGEDGSYAVLTVMDHQLDADLNYYEPDILLHIENCGSGIVVGKLT